MSLISHNYVYVLENTCASKKSLEHKHGVVFTPSWLDTTRSDIATVSLRCSYIATAH